MKISENGRKLIEQFEGLILGAYDDATDRVVPPGGTCRGTLTIGYGHTTAAGLPPVHVGDKITQEQADQILASDLAAVEAEISRLVTVPLNQNQVDGIGSFEFNTGALAHSSGLKYLNERDFESAWYIFSQYIHANGKTLTGLVKRREAEKNLFFTAPKLGQAQPSVPATRTSKTFMEIILDLFKQLLGRH